MEREVGGGIGMGNICKPMAVSFQCMTKSTTNKKKNIIMCIEYIKILYAFYTNKFEFKNLKKCK